MAQYKRGDITANVKQITTMTKAEVRLFFYFLTKETSLPTEKRKAFQNLLENGHLPSEMGYMSRNGGQVFCIRRGNAGYYDFYIAENETSGFNKVLRKALAKAKA